MTIDKKRFGAPQWASRLRRYWPLAAVFLLFVNAILHDPRVGYDAAAHRDYAITLATLKLPTEAQSTEFFSPPLAYLPAAFALWMKAPLPLVTKAWQLLQVFYAAGIIVHLVWLFDALRGGRIARIAGFASLFMAAVWWRSFAIIRPEALLALLLTAALYQMVRLAKGDRQAWRFVLAGSLWGAACVTRQWAIFALLASLPACLAAPAKDSRWWTGTAAAAAACFLIAAPFYLSMLARYGTLRPFNRPPISESNLHWNWNPVAVAKEPFSRGQIDRPLNILYADTFGDYWMYFLARGRTPNHRFLVGTPLIDTIATASHAVPNNVRALTPYLGVVMLVSAPATLVVAAAYVWSVITCSLGIVDRNRPTSSDLVLLVAAIGGTAIGYGWFVWSYAATANDTDTVKATYLVQIWPLLAALLGIFVEEIYTRKRTAGCVLVGLLAFALIVNAGTYLTRCITF